MLKAHLKCTEKKWDRTKTILLIHFLLRQTNWSKLIKQASKSLRAFEQEIKINHISEVLISSHTNTVFSLLLRTHFYITSLKPWEKENAWVKEKLDSLTAWMKLQCNSFIVEIGALCRGSAWRKSPQSVKCTKVKKRESTKCLVDLGVEHYRWFC